MEPRSLRPDPISGGTSRGSHSLDRQQYFLAGKVVLTRTTSGITSDPSSSLVQALIQIVGAAHVWPWAASASHPSSLSQAFAPGSFPEWGVAPGTAAELAAVVACARKHHAPLLPYGAASKIHWGGLVRGAKLMVSTQRLNRLIEHAVGDMTVTVEAGMPFGQLQALLQAKGQFLALDPAYSDRATIGGILATRDTGSLRHRYGGVRDLGLGLSFVRADGELVKAGGRVVKNVAGYDLMKLLTGSFGTLGILTQVTLRLYPHPETSRTLLVTGTAGAIAQATQTLLANSLTPTAIDLLSPQILAGLNCSAEVGLLVRFQGLSPSVQVQSDRWLEMTQPLELLAQAWTGAAETQLWQQLQHQLWPPLPPEQPQVISKIGVLADQGVATLQAIAHACEAAAIPSWVRIHAGSGLGVVRVAGPIAQLQTLLPRLRSQTQQAGGFLTVLEAPISLKETLEVWGYTGSALPLMQQLKTQFDPEALLSPNRFVGGM